MPSLRIWLKWTIKDDKNFDRGNLLFHIYKGSVRIFQECDRHYVDVPDMEKGPYPEGDLSKYFETFTLYDSWDPVVHRITGVYRRSDCRGELNLVGGKYILKMYGLIRQELKYLHRAIRQGRILPTESWEETQIADNSAESEITLADKEDVVDGVTVSPFVAVPESPAPQTPTPGVTKPFYGTYPTLPHHDFPDHSGYVFGGAKVFPGPPGPQDGRE